MLILSLTQVDLASFMTRAALELIGQAGIGYSFDTLEEDEPTHPYCKAAVGLMWIHSFLERALLT